MKKRSLFSRFFRRERQIPFSIKSVLSFYLSLMGRYWYLLGFMAVLAVAIAVPIAPVIAEKISIE